MLGLQAPPGEPLSGGRSRYSKALPSVPIPVANDINLPPPPLPSKDTTPNHQLPSPRVNADNKSVKSIARKPVGSSLSKPGTPLPETPSVISPLRTSSSSTGSMAIPRRPVGGTLQPPVLPTLVVPPEPSPTDSINSLLSAYSREPDAPMSGSTYTTASTKHSFRDSGSRSPSTREESPAGGYKSSQTLPSTVKSGSGPAPPAKDDELYSQPKPLPSAPLPNQTSAPRPEIWKRRPQTTEKNKELPDLKLNYSHGSTASISSIQTAVIKASSDNSAESKSGSKSAEEKDKPSPPRLPVIGLPGRNVRPAAKDTAQDTTKPMGKAISKVAGIKDQWEASSKTPDAKGFPTRTDSKRPPTPEYRTGDIDPPLALSENVTKPASPISATGSPKEGARADTSKDLRQQQFSLPKATIKSAVGLAPTPTSKFPSSTPQSGFESRLTSATPDLRLATSLQDLRRGGPSPPGEDSAHSARRPYLPPNDRSRGPSTSPDSGLSRTPPSGPNGLGLSSGAPRRPGTASGGSDPRIVYSETQGPMYRGRDGTLYAEMKNTGVPDPKASYFPIQTDKPLGPGTIIASRPLNQSHFNCFQKHKVMNRRSNRHCPLTCQTCDRADVEDRWVCTFCHLRICETCLRALNGHQRILRSLVDQLGTSTPLSLSSASRPGSALGLELPA
ncbi:hypothetical protein QQS21_008169 [Conoideocrella luteorostrata]|uniref:Uncharacterized protein n=1 Tax=Conoideocrella luteorostrata TaxID=1105319 RepID=A0AAJ0CJH7_9HYPO|nr:hypothetical protein QQS21_008169 [Conoideocrella luteorostrata]